MQGREGANEGEKEGERRVNERFRDRHAMRISRLQRRRACAFLERGEAQVIYDENRVARSLDREAHEQRFFLCVPPPPETRVSQKGGLSYAESAIMCLTQATNTH